MLVIGVQLNDLLSSLKCIKLETLLTLFIDLRDDQFGELRSGSLGLKR